MGRPGEPRLETYIPAMQRELERLEAFDPADAMLVEDPFEGAGNVAEDIGLGVCFQ